ncbi:MAG: hypothetical protein Q9160_002656 [Pyrenula sp. 1 TL-2023]
MATVEVNLREGDPEPEQHLDEGEHIERVVVPLSELYDRLQGSITGRSASTGVSEFSDGFPCPYSQIEKLYLKDDAYGLLVARLRG